MWRNATGLLTRGSLPRRLPGPRASGVVAGERLPSQRRDRPGFAPGSLTAFLCVGRAYQRTVFGSVCWPLAREAEGRALDAGSFYDPDGIKLEILSRARLDQHQELEGACRHSAYLRMGGSARRGGCDARIAACETPSQRVRRGAWGAVTSTRATACHGL